ncbi:hypothetical protein SARC_15213 [Sphaeroforma arctica JP610]|uniref:MucBP domain-containing protein n=1 Tax=Sphaeroforma arctica JP610 TaxID=667725 RepID=A0A0L0F663_9EUKA|nr:hypothetical protein SARC_15213 [Sphaeroforma arctica JP610]KNC72232.1 hypothetical protein SARC_15213 [Sphaeroforma arctica JP610]|eukprot:XP_014146134.1 hypothetical protein SARC_15213 [Sphaeroforma arctica JP610]
MLIRCRDSQGVSVELVDEDGNVVNMDDVNLDDVEYVDEDGNPVDINGNPLPNKGEAHAQTPDDNRSVNSDEVHYVDENGNPINPDDVEVEYVDEFGNIVDPDTLDDDVELVRYDTMPTVGRMFCTEL